MFSVAGSALENLLYVTSSQKQETNVSLVLKESDTESENLSSLIRFSVSDSQKTDSSKDVSFRPYRYIIIFNIIHLSKPKGI